MTDLTDASGYPGGADEVFTPSTEEEVAAILARATRESKPVTLMGAMTGVTGGAVPGGGWGLSLARLRRMEIRPGRAVVGAACCCAKCSKRRRRRDNSMRPTRRKIRRR